MFDILVTYTLLLEIRGLLHPEHILLHPNLNYPASLAMSTSAEISSHIQRRLSTPVIPIHTLAETWLRMDKDPVTHAEIEALLQSNNIHELESRLRGRILFGTAGLRARMEAGFTRMNCVTVIQASQGLAAYVLAQNRSAGSRGVVIGHDARYNSEKFARLAAAAFIEKGIKVWWFDRNVHTPLVPFAVSQRGAAAGVMVTASHNPAKDNGYKVYWSNGCQIIPPHDRGIATAIEQNLEPVSWNENFSSAGTDLVEEVFEPTATAYYHKIKELINLPPNTSLPQFVYTPIHGVGLPFLEQAIQHIIGNISSTIPQTAQPDPPFITVPEQAQPDPSFPTVKFPNPEEAGALDLAMSTADKHNITLIIATDPDADRLAVAEKITSSTTTDENSTEPHWHQFTGNELGLLLASYILSLHQPPHPRPSKPLAILTSTVSSTTLRQISQTDPFPFHHVETLTGFKWLGNVAQSLQNPSATQNTPSPSHSHSPSHTNTPSSPQSHTNTGYTVPFAFEEALGYMFPSVVWDKDGITAACVFLSAAAKWKDELHVTPYERLQQLYQKHGYFADANTYLTSPSPETTNAVFAAIRKVADVTDPPYPNTLGKYKILSWRDLTLGYDSSTPDHVPVLPVDPGSQMITIELEGGGRVTVRGSGTEPKIKVYVEGKGINGQEARRSADEVRDVVVKEWFGERWGLRLAGT